MLAMAHGLMKLIFAGSGEFGLPVLRHLVESNEHEIVQVFTQPDRPAGRGLKMTPTPIARFALEQSLPLIRTANINDLTLPEADLMLVIAFGQKIAPHIVDHSKLGSINLHGSRLPKCRGAAPVNWAIINGDATSGNSIIRLAPKMDAGAILGQSEISIGALETAGELHHRLAQDGVALVGEVLDRLASRDAIEVPQDESQATLAPKLKREDARIDWNRDTFKIACQIRGMYPWPGCRVALQHDGTEIARTTLVRARPVSVDRANHQPREILPSGSICAGDGAVEIVELQPEGKRPMPMSAYRNGHRWEPGMRLESIT